MTFHAQPGILRPVPPTGRHMFFTLIEPAGAQTALAAFASLANGDATVVGLGPQLV